jgi:hypothetical protein
MSYSRFSSNDFQCDVYCYESAEGFMVHVAGNRVVFDEELPAPVSLEDVEEFVRRDQRVLAMVATAGREPIGLPHDGETFVLDTPGACADKLVELAALGYVVPQTAIDALREEAAEE